MALSGMRRGTATRWWDSFHRAPRESGNLTQSWDSFHRAQSSEASEGASASAVWRRNSGMTHHEADDLRDPHTVPSVREILMNVTNDPPNDLPSCEKSASDAADKAFKILILYSSPLQRC